MWQPIETAPKDGTTIMVWERHSWSNGGTPHFVRWIGAPHDKWSIDGFKSVRAPTHWTPLPEPPVTP